MVEMISDYQSAFFPDPFRACLMAQEQSDQDGKDGESPGVQQLGLLLKRG